MSGKIPSVLGGKYILVFVTVRQMYCDGVDISFNKYLQLQLHFHLFYLNLPNRDCTIRNKMISISFKIFIIITKLKIYFEYYLAKAVLGAPWCTGHDPH